jgi:hypothetical protein
MNKEIKQNYNKLFKLVVKYREFPVNYTHKIDTNTKITITGTIDLTWDGYGEALSDGCDIDAKIEAPIEQLVDFFDRFCNNLWDFREEFSLWEKIDKKYETAFNKFWDDAEPYLDFFKNIYKKADEPFDGASFVCDVYEKTENEMLEHLDGLSNPELIEKKKFDKELAKKIRELVAKKDFKGIKDLLKDYD